MNTKKFKIIFITCLSIFVFGVAFFLIKNLFLGKVEVLLINEGVLYRLDNSAIKHRGNTTIGWVIPGKHRVNAFGENSTHYISKSFDIEVRAGETTRVNILLEPTEKNPDYPAAEFNPFDEKSKFLLEKLPITNDIGFIYFNYAENEYRVDLSTDSSKEDAIRWFYTQGLKIDESVILWGDLKQDAN